MEFTLWMIFVMVFATVHYAKGAMLQVALLGAIALVRGLGLDRPRPAVGSSKVSRMVCALCIVIFAGIALQVAVKLPKKIHEAVRPSQDPYRQAVEFVNSQDRNGVVMFPFTKEDTFFLYTKKPGFFASYYVVAFIPLYQVNADEQKKAYDKFKLLESQFGIDTWARIKKDPSHYRDPWQRAWETKVDWDFVERWGKSYNIRYLIRERALPPLPYRHAYENEEYIVYQR
jgi:hypothetical protein